MTTMEKIIAFQKIALSFQRIALSIAAILLGISTIIYTTTSTTAAKPNTTYESGKYMMQLNSIHNGSDTEWYILVWDTEIGKSKMYYGSGKLKKIEAAHSSYNIPSNPL